MHIVFSIDDAFALYCGVLITSICENNRDDEIYFYIISSGICVSNKQIIEEVVSKYNKKVVFYNISTDTLRNCPISGHISIATYFRILIPEILLDLEKVLYLDCDIIVLSSLKALWDIDISNYAIAAVPDMYDRDLRIYNRLEYDMRKGYFNAGVLLMNLKYWRARNISNKILSYIDNNSNKIKYWDQDALNYILQDEKLILPLCYNVHDGFYWKKHFLNNNQINEIFDARLNPVILHYTGAVKPWYKECEHPRKNDYIKYVELFLSSDRIIKYLNLKKSIRFYLKKILILFHIISDHHTYYNV